MIRMIILPIILAGCSPDKTEKPKVDKVEKPATVQTPAQPVEAQKDSSLSSENTVNVASSTKAEREKLIAAVKAQTKDPQIYLQLGLSYYDEARALSNAERQPLENLYTQAIENLEMARSLFEADKHPLPLYRALWESYANAAYLPVTFNQGTDPDKGVVPLNMKWMKKAIETYEEAKIKYPSDPSVESDIGNKLATDLKNLEAVYIANVQRQWEEMRESGYRRPETYNKGRGP